MKYVCELCGLIYDEEAGLPSKGISPGTKFQNLPEDFECPGCYSERQAFYPCSRHADFAAAPELASSTPMPVLACTDVKRESDK